MNYCRIGKKLVNEKSRKNSTFLYKCNYSTGLNTF